MNTIKLNTIGLNDVSLNYVGAKVRANSGGGGGEDLAAIPFYVEAIEPLNVKFTNAHEYSRDNKTWTSANNEDIAVEAGQRVYFRATSVLTGSGRNYVRATNKYNVGGNIMSLLYGSEYIGKYTIEYDTVFYTLFSYEANLINAHDLRLPATTLANGCYRYMFQNCTSLVNAPELPATTLAYDCYSYMFYGCTSLVNAPKLPATTLAEQCYDYMFTNCTSLVNAPELPATTLAKYCYRYMFYNCASLVNAPNLPATTLAYGCYRYMFEECKNLVNAPNLPATTLDSLCYSRMFYNCTSLINAPYLPAIQLELRSYYYMFSGCRNLQYVKAMFTTTPGSDYTGNWLNGVAANGTFVKNATATWDVRGINGVPDGWTIETAEA